MVLKISTISKSTGYWIVPSIFIYFTRFASKNFRAARDDSMEIEQYSRAASARKEKIVDFFVCLHGAGPICKQIKAVEWGGQTNKKRRSA